MAEPDPENGCPPSPEREIPDDPFESEMPVGMTLEHIIDLTGEMEHLNELVMLNLEKEGGFTSQAAYFTVVQPILDLLEVEIRFRYRTGMTKRQMKIIIGDLIDTEISLLQ